MTQRTDRKHEVSKPMFRPIDEAAEYADMNEDGKAAYRAAKRRKHRVHGTVVVVGTVATIIGGTFGPWWCVFGGAFAFASLAALLNQSPDIGALSKGRLAEQDPPEQLSWEEHVKKYGHRDGEPLTEEEERAMITGEVDDPDWRENHLS